MKPVPETHRSAALLGIAIAVAALLAFAWGYSHFGPILNR